MKLNEKILHYRKAAKLSQEELADRVGVSRQAVSKWELGDATPEVDKLLALAHTFGVSTDELLSEYDPAELREQAEPHGEVPSHIEADTKAEDGFDRAFGHIGGLIRKYGWVAGIYVLLAGLGITGVGALARFAFGTMLGESNRLMSDYGALPFGGMGGFTLVFANFIIVIGIAMMIAGALLAVILYRKGNKRP